MLWNPNCVSYGILKSHRLSLRQPAIALGSISMVIFVKTKLSSTTASNAPVSS